MSDQDVRDGLVARSTIEYAKLNNDMAHAMRAALRYHFSYGGSVKRRLVLLVALLAVAATEVITASVLWSWFVVATFSLPPLSIAKVVGLWALWVLLFKPLPSKKDLEASDDELMDRAKLQLTRSLGVLLIGYVATLFS